MNKKSLIILGVTTLITFQHVFAAPSFAKGNPVMAPASEFDYFKFAKAPTCTTKDTDKPIYNGRINEKYRWVDFNVQFHPKHNKFERESIQNAMYQLSEVLPCVSFTTFEPEETPPGDYIHLVRGKDNGCSSLVGRIGGRQLLNLQTPGCMSVGTIMHEMIHALGFDHEQSRPDRDDFIIIHPENIEPGMEVNFEKLSASRWSTFGTKYNYRSIMHYEGDAFGIDGAITMEARDGSTLGSEGILQDTDIAHLKKMYNC